MLRHFLWWSAGADTAILEVSPMSEQTRFSVTGLTVILTSVLGCLSGAYAVYIFSGSIFLCLMLGVVWGILITNLNRLLFTSMRLIKARSVRNLVYVLLYTCVSGLVAVIISVPLELKIFESSIRQRVLQEREVRLRAANRPYDAEIAHRSALVDSNQKRLYEEVAGVAGSRRVGFGPISRAVGEVIDSERYNIQKLRHEEDLTKQQIMQSPIGFVEQATAFSSLTKLDSTEKLPLYFIRILLFTLELLPLVLNVAIDRSMYELLSRKREYDILTAGAATPEVSSNATGGQPSRFEVYCEQMMADLERQMREHKNRSGDMLRNGLIIIIAGIMLYIGLAYYLLLFYFSGHPFTVYIMLSLSLMFVFLQFLGGWFLQQHKGSMKSILYINSMKPEISRWLLGYFAIREASGDRQGLDRIELLIALLTSGSKTFDHQIMSIQEANFAREVFDALSDLKNMIGKNPIKPT